MQAIFIVGAVTLVVGFLLGRAMSSARTPVVPMRPLSRNEQDELVEVLARDGRIPAIRRARELTGADLKSAHDAIKLLEAEAGPRRLGR